MTTKTKIGFYGAIGSHTYNAARTYISNPKHNEYVLSSFKSFSSLYDALSNKQVKYIVVPYHNNLVGFIDTGYTMSSNIEVTSQLYLPIHNNLITGYKYMEETDITHIIGNKYILEECSKYLSTLNNVKVLNTNASTNAIDIIQQNSTYALIGSAGIVDGNSRLSIMKENIDDCNDNTTIFNVLMLTEK
jgi:prephenate dehydratase